MRIEHVALNVADPVAMADWWCQHLGMRIVRSAGEPTHTRFLADSAGRTVLELYRQKAPVPDYFAQDPFVLHIAFLTDDLDRDRERLLAAGCRSAGEPSKTPAGDRLGFLHDPWGVAIQLVSRAEPLL
jgi:glyoxylase I family protein